MTNAYPISVGSERFDVALSFVTRNDLRVAEELRDLLQPPFSVFLHTDHPQILSGARGVTAYSKIFKCDTRLTVILLRADWGKTRRTAIEETAIRDRALQVDRPSVIVVRMEENAELPSWIPSGTVCLPGWLERRQMTAQAIGEVARAARFEHVL